MLSVVSYNILLGRQLENIIGWANAQEEPFDIICFQEFPSTKQPLLQKLRKASSYQHSFAHSFMRNGESYGVLTLINKKKINVTGEKVVHIGTSWVEKMMGYTGGRNVLVTHGTYQRKAFTLINAHLVAYSTNMHRRNQLATVLTELAEKESHEAATIIMGDFNYSSLIWQKNLFAFMQQHGFANAYTMNTHTLPFFKKHQLDYVFYKKSRVSDVKVTNLPYSDHLPISFSVSFD